MIKPQTLTAILKITMLAVALNSASLAQGETLNMPTTNIVIEKLDRLLETLDTDSTSKIPMTLRLADLHADRARLFELSEQNKNDHCDTCVTARKDRIEAIRLYNSVFTSLDKETKSKVLSQLAHLYELTTQSYKALELYKSVLKSEKDYSPELIGQASIGLGEMEFNLAKYKDAAKDFKRALEIKNLNRQGYVTTRLAWTYFHLGNLALAEKTMFSVLTNQNTADGSLKEESARDYATFLSQGKVGPSEIKNLSLASPEKVRKENLIYLATELDRLGKKNEAVLVWKSVGEASHTDSDDLSEHFRLAQLQYDLGHKDLTVGELVKTVSIWKDKGCKATEENCALLKAKFRKMLTDWAAAEERQPTATLVKAYAIYISIFPEMEMSYWAAQAARKINMFKESIGFYRSASEFAKIEIKNKNTKAATIFEGACLGEIEVAELSKDDDLRSHAYDHYISEDANGTKIIDVKYQRAHLVYEEKKFADAANMFHDIATISDSSQLVTREKATDISIEALIASKNVAPLEVWALEYSRIFKNREAEFQKTARDAVINTEVATINNDKSSSSDLKQSLEKLNKVELTKATPSEKRNYFKDKLIVAEKLKNLSEVSLAADGLLSVRPLSEEDRELALSRKEWAAETTLNFNLAYELAQKLKMSHLSREERLFKLAMLAELAGKNPDSYYEEIIKKSKNRQAVQGVIAKLVRKSKNPTALYKKYFSKLKSNPTLCSTLALEIFGQTHDYALANSVTRNKNLRSTPAGQALYRFEFLKDFDLINSLAAHSKISKSSPQSLKKSLIARLNLIKQTEVQVRRAINTRDWTLELITLDAVKRQEDKLASDILSLPIPKGLKPSQKLQYRILIGQQAKPYIQRSQEVALKINELWSAENVTSLLNDLKNSKGPLRNVVRQEIKLISRFIPADRKREFENDLNRAILESNLRPENSTINEARQKVKSDPFDATSIEKLKILEGQAGHDTIVAYLDGRLGQLQNGVRR